VTDDRNQPVPAPDPTTPDPTDAPVPAEVAPAAAGSASRVPAQGRSSRPAGVLAQILGHDDEDDDRPLPDLPPLPADPRWRIEHLPMIFAIGIALALCATSAGFLIGGPAVGLGLGAGVLLVAVGYSVSTLAIGWADTLRPALVLPVGLTVYVIKYILIALILISAGASGWDGAKPMAFGIAIGAVVMTAAQAVWIARRANRRAAESA
jgi:hypothetical protein